MIKALPNGGADALAWGKQLLADGQCGNSRCEKGPKRYYQRYVVRLEYVVGNLRGVHQVVDGDKVEAGAELLPEEVFCEGTKYGCSNQYGVEYNCRGHPPTLVEGVIGEQRYQKGKRDEHVAYRDDIVEGAHCVYLYQIPDVPRNIGTGKDK